MSGQLGQRLRQRDDLELARVACRARLDEPFEEQLSERLVMAVQLAVGGDHDQRRLVIGE